MNFDKGVANKAKKLSADSMKGNLWRHMQSLLTSLPKAIFRKKSR